MFCFNCGKELVESASFCHYCGTNVSKVNKVEPPKPATPPIVEPPILAVIEGEDAAVVGTVYETPKPVINEPVVTAPVVTAPIPPKPIEMYFGYIFSRPIFLVATILFTVFVSATSISTFTGGVINFPVIETMIAISMWILFAAAKGRSRLDKYAKPLKTIKVAALLNFIGNWVVAGAYGMMGVLTIGEVASSEITDSMGDLQEISLINTSASIEQYGFIFIAYIILCAICIFNNIFVNKKILDYLKTANEKIKDGNIHTEGFNAFKVRIAIAAGVKAVLSIGAFLISEYSLSTDYLLGEYTVSIWSVISLFLIIGVLIAAVCCLVQSLRTPKLASENIVDNSEKDDII